MLDGDADASRARDAATADHDRAERLLAPLDAGTFRRLHWTKLPWLDPPRPERLALFAETFASFEVDELLREHTGDVRVWLQTPVGTQKSIDLPPARALDLHACGLTLYAVGHPRLESLATTLARLLGSDPRGADGSIFANRGGVGTPMHFDANENFTIQLTGRKRWHVAANDAVDAPLDNWVSRTQVGPTLRRSTAQCLDRCLPAATTTYDLEPGSLLYLPRGYWHATEALDEANTSINVSLRPTTWYDLGMRALGSILIGDRRWRQTVPSAGGGAAEAELRGLLSSLASALQTVEPADVLGWRDDTPSNARRHGRNPLASLGVESVATNEGGGRSGIVSVTVPRERGTEETRFSAEDEILDACLELAEASSADFAPADWRERLGERLGARVEPEDLAELLDGLSAAGFLRGAR